MGSVLIKIGGALLGEPDRLEGFWRSVREIRSERSVVIVHGGGPQATAMARRLGHEPRMVHGRRVTTDLDLDIIRWTLRGELSARLVSEAVIHRLKPVGISGIDGGILEVERRPPWQVEGESVDFGWVGDVTGIRTELLETLTAGGFLPIVAPLGLDREGRVYNVNADTVASAIAVALGVDQFVMVAESGGVWKDAADPASKLAEIDRRMYENGIAGKWIEGGMRVKLHVGFEARTGGIPEVFICGPDDVAHPEAGTRVV